MYREIYSSCGCSSSGRYTGSGTRRESETSRASSRAAYGLFRANNQTVETGQDVRFSSAETSEGMTLSDDGTTVRVGENGVYRIDFTVTPLSSSGALMSLVIGGVRADGEPVMLADAGVQVSGTSLVRLSRGVSVELRVTEASVALGAQLRAYICLVRIA